MTRVRRLIGLAPLFASFPVLASDPASLLTILVSFFFVIPWSIVNLVLVLRAKSRFTQRDIALRFTTIGLIAPILGASVFILDRLQSGIGEPGAAANWPIAACILIAASAIAFLPLYFYGVSRGDV